MLKIDTHTTTSIVELTFKFTTHVGAKLWESLIVQVRPESLGRLTARKNMVMNRNLRLLNGRPEHNLAMLKFLKLKAYLKINATSYSRYYAEVCNECRGSSTRLSAWTTSAVDHQRGLAPGQHRNVAATRIAGNSADLTSQGMDRQTYRIVIFHH